MGRAGSNPASGTTFLRWRPIDHADRSSRAVLGPSFDDCSGSENSSPGSAVGRQRNV